MKVRMHTDALRRLRADVGMLMPSAGATDAKWCALFPKGQWHHHSGNDFNFDATLVAEFIANWKAAGSPPLPITLHHVEDDLASYEKAEASQAQGWIEDLRPGTGDIALEGAVKWTDDAKGLIAADKYRYLSPEWSMAHVDRRTGSEGGPWLYGAALLNDPFFHTMPRVAASEKQTTTQTQAAPKAKEQHMLKRICAALRLSESATEEEVVAALEKIVAANTEAETKLTAAAKAASETSALRATVDVLKASNESLEKKFAAAEVEKKELAVTTMIDGARREGKAMPAPLVASITVLAKHDFEEAKKLIAALPVDKALGKEVGVNGTGADTAETARAKLTAAAEAISKETGIKLSDARDRAYLKHPELAAIAAQNLTSPKERS
jgi:phage I-like protein